MKTPFCNLASNHKATGASKTRFALALCLCATLVACSSYNPQPSSAVLPSKEAARISDQTIYSDQKSMQDLQNRLRSLNDRGDIKIGNYHHAKAQCWLDVAKDEYHENDRTGFIEGALGESLKLIKGLEANAANLPTDTPHVANAKPLRPDLWQRIAGYKTQTGFRCVAPAVACMEVELVHAGHENAQTGWRQARPYIHLVEELDEIVKRDLAACAQPVPLVAKSEPPPPAPLPPPAPIVLPPTPEKPTLVVKRLSLNALALFQFDLHQVQNIRPEDLQQIDAFVATAKKLKSAEELSVTGYADPYNTEAYNLNLSRNRARTVAALLSSRGMPFMQQAKVFGYGETDQFAQCLGKMSKPERVQCYLPNRRVEVEIRGYE